MNNFFEKIKNYIIDNIPTAIITGFVMLFIWLLSSVWNGNNEKLTDIAKSSQSTAQSMQSLVVFVKEDRVEINNLKRRVADLEEYKKHNEDEIKDFWKNYYYSPNHKGK